MNCFLKSLGQKRKLSVLVLKVMFLMYWMYWMFWMFWFFPMVNEALMNCLFIYFWKTETSFIVRSTLTHPINYWLIILQSSIVNHDTYVTLLSSLTLFTHLTTGCYILYVLSDAFYIVYTIYYPIYDIKVSTSHYFITRKVWQWCFY